MPRILTLCACVMLVVTSPALGVTMLETGASASGPIPMVDLKTNPPGTIVSMVSYPPPPDVGRNIDATGPPEAIATATDGGVPDSFSDSSVAVDAYMTDGNPWDFEAFANTSYTTTNLSPNPASAWFSWGLDPFTLVLQHGNGHGAGVVLGFEFELLLNGSTVTSGWAQFEGTDDGHTLTYSGPWGTTAPPPATVSLGVGGDDRHGWGFTGLGGNINLGTLAPAEAVTVETHLRAYLSTPGTNVGGAFDGGDLTTLTQIFPGDDGPPPEEPPIPEPASAMLLAIGAVAIGLRRRIRF